VKHSGSHTASVVLERIDDNIHLSISDEGSGFDVESALLKGGLGLISMSERLRLVGGEISIKSQPSEGTLISVFVPLNGQSLCDEHSEGVTNEKVLPFPVQNVCEANRVLT
jgi:two-component system NarL family sensor kinase